MKEHSRRYRAGLGTLVAFCLWGVGFSARADEEKLEVGALAPVFTLKAINADVVGGNAYIGLDKYTGGDASEPKKAVLVAFFQSDCEPCKNEMPFLQLLFDAYKDKGLQVLSLSIDKEQERIDVARAVGQQANVKFPILSDHFNYVVRRYLVTKLPSVFLVDGEGKVAMARVGYAEDASKDLHDEVRKALGLPGSEPVPQALTDYMAAPHAWGTGAPIPGIEPRPAVPAPAAGTSPAGGVPPAPSAPAPSAPAPGAAPAASAPAEGDAEKSETPAKRKGKRKAKGKRKGKRKQQQGE